MSWVVTLVVFDPPHLKEDSGQRCRRSQRRADRPEVWTTVFIHDDFDDRGVTDRNQDADHDGDDHADKMVMHVVGKTQRR